MRMRRSLASCILGDREGLIADFGAAGPRRSRRTCAVGNAAGPFANADRSDHALRRHVDHRHRAREGVGNEHASAVIADNDPVGIPPVVRVLTTAYRCVSMTDTVLSGWASVPWFAT